VYSSLPISVYMWNISTLSAKNFVNHHFKWRMWPERGQNSIAYCGGGALGSALSVLYSGRRVSLDASSWLGSGCSAGSLTCIGKNVSLTHRKIGYYTQLLSGHSSCNCPETSLPSSMFHSTKEKHASCHLWTPSAPEAPCKV
jgi:hypothetical protein